MCHHKTIQKQLRQRLGEVCQTSTTAAIYVVHTARTTAPQCPVLTPVPSVLCAYQVPRK